MDVFDYIEVFYNRKPRHERLGGTSPVAYEDQKLVAMSVYGRPLQALHPLSTAPPKRKLCRMLLQRLTTWARTITIQNILA